MHRYGSTCSYTNSILYMLHIYTCGSGKGTLPKMETGHVGIHSKGVHGKTLLTHYITLL